MICVDISYIFQIKVNYFGGIEVRSQGYENGRRKKERRQQSVQVVRKPKYEPEAEVGGNTLFTVVKAEVTQLGNKQTN